jgi:hypothetical protein
VIYALIGFTRIGSFVVEWHKDAFFWSKSKADVKLKYVTLQWWLDISISLNT